MSNTVITNYTDLNGPSTKADSSVVVIVNKDGSLSVDQNLLGTLMGTDGTQGAISVVRVGHEGKPDDATDSETEDDKVHHVTLSVDSYYDEPNSIIKYDSGAEMLQSLRIETRENSLVGFQNDHCYTPLISPSQELPKKSDSMIPYEESVIEIIQTPPPPPPKSVANSKKITILDQKIIPKGKKIIINSTESPVILKGNDVLNKPLPVTKKTKDVKSTEKVERQLKPEDNIESSSISSSGESMPDRDSDSDYRDTKDRTGSIRLRKTKLKPRILKGVQSAKISKLDAKTIPRFKANKSIARKENKEKIVQQKLSAEHKDGDVDLESLLPVNKISTVPEVTPKEIGKVVVKQTPKPIKKEKKTPAHVTALLSDMTSLFSTPDVIRRVSTENKTPVKETLLSDKKSVSTPKLEVKDDKITDTKPNESTEKVKVVTSIKAGSIPKEKVVNQTEKPYDPFPQLDEVSLAQILQDTRSAPSNTAKAPPLISPGNAINSPGLAGPLSPTLDLLGGLQPEEEGLPEDLLMHVAQLVESSENLQEVIDKQVLGKVDSNAKTAAQLSLQQGQGSNLYTQTLSKTAQKNIPQRKDPIEIVRRDGRVIKLPPIEAPATRSSKRKSQINETPPTTNEVGAILSNTNAVHTPLQTTPEPQVPVVSKQYVNKKLTNKKQESLPDTSIVEKISAESQESWNSEDDPNRLWCICKQPHNNRFMICCDSCEDWFHGKCVNITKAMGQQMEEQGIEWRCPNCIKKAKGTPKSSNKAPPLPQKKNESEPIASEIKSTPTKEITSKTNCIVCKKPARASSIYCSDSCILKHAQDSLGGGNQNSNSKDENDPGKSQEKQKSESRVIVYERKSGRLLAGPNAPTAENLKAWLQRNPTFEVVRPGTLSTTRPNTSKKKSSNEPNKIQTTLNFERIPRKSLEQATPSKSPQVDMKEKVTKPLPSPKEEVKTMTQPKTPVTSKSNQVQLTDTPKASTSTPKPTIEPRKIVRSISSRSQSTNEKSPVTTPPASRRKEVLENRSRMNSDESIRDNVKKSLQEQMSIRMAETEGPKFTEAEIKQYAVDTEIELHDLFRDVGMKYKAKYRSLIFNIKDRKNLSLWEKICDKSITPKQLVRLSPEELASQELAQWRDKEAKYQLELIKKSELDLLAASKTYVLKTHKGEEVMETKESVSTELDPNVPVEDVVSVLNDTINEEPQKEKTPSPVAKLHKVEKKRNSSRKRERESSSSRQSKRSKRDSEKKSRSSRRRKSGSREKQSKEVQRRSTRRSDKKTSRSRSVSKDRTKSDVKDRSEVRDRSRHRSKSREKSTRRSKSRVSSRSNSKVRERSKSQERTRRRSDSRESSKQRRSSRSKRNSTSTDEKFKQRSRSQETTFDKSKNDSTDSDSIERPKSAMLKEVHPEYDPHEPMITSAFSEEDLRKSREDVYEENYENDIKDIETDYDPSKSFALSTGVTMPSSVYMGKQDHVSAEAESDQEPSSTVENAAATVWNGCINMVDVARFYVAAHEVSGSAVDLEEDLTTELDIVGRINPDTVWDYIGKTKKASNKDIVILRLQAANDEEKMQYIALYSYLSSRNRLGVVKVSSTTTVKDFYIVPLPANTSLPPVLLPLDGPGLGDVKTHLLLGIVIRQRKKRLAPHIPKDIIPAKVARESQKRSYTPPVLSKGSYTPPSSPKRRPALPLPQYSSTALSNTVKDKIAASLASAGEDEAYSPDSSSSNGSVSLPSQSAGSSNTLRSKMEELNRQIEEQKQQIFKMAQANNSAGEDEAYSPSRPMTPSPPVVPLADIALPSNLQEILATIKQRSETATDVDMRTMPLPQ